MNDIGKILKVLKVYTGKIIKEQIYLYTNKKIWDTILLG